MSNSGTNTFMSTPGNLRSRQSYGAYVPNSNNQSRMYLLLPHSSPLGATLDPWWSFEERVTTGPLGLSSSFAAAPRHSPIYNNDMARDMNYPILPRQRQSNNVRESTTTTSPPSSMLMVQYRNMQVPTIHVQEEPADKVDASSKKNKKMKKEIYNPTLKRINKRLNLYYRDISGYNIDKKEDKNEDEGKACAICLDDFEPKEVVMITPCTHMFHEDCIVPWVNTNSKCPVCRFEVSL